MRENVYEVEKNVEKVLRGGSTGFLTKKVCLAVQRRLKKVDFEIFSPFEEAEKVILYGNNIPRVRLFRIDCYKDDELKHSAIMGSLFGLNITSEMFGDIVKWNGDFYVYLLSDISDLVVKELRTIGNVSVSLVEVDADLLEDFEREYERQELIVSSLRIDTIISRLIGCNREGIQEKVRNKEIIVNDVVVKKVSDVLSIGDNFSIRKYGKFRFRETIGKTKKDNYIVVIDRYV